MDRRILLIIASCGLALSSVLLWVQAVVAVDSGAAVWVVLSLLSVQQAFYAVNAPTRAAAIPRMLAGGQLPAANSLNMTVMQFGAIVGPLSPASGRCPQAGVCCSAGSICPRCI